MGEKHYVYSARTTEQGLALINKARGDRGWDEFVNQAVAGHYGLDLAAISLPPRKFLEGQKAKREAKAAEKAQRKADREAEVKAKKAAAKKVNVKVEKPAKKAARQATEAAA